MLSAGKCLTGDGRARSNGLEGPQTIALARASFLSSFLLRAQSGLTLRPFGQSFPNQCILGFPDHGLGTFVIDIDLVRHRFGPKTLGRDQPGKCTCHNVWLAATRRYCQDLQTFGSRSESRRIPEASGLPETRFCCVYIQETICSIPLHPSNSQEVQPRALFIAS